MKYLDYFLGTIVVIIFAYLLYSHFIPSLFYKEEMDKPFVDEFHDIIKKDIVKVTIYSKQYPKWGKNFKVAITDKTIIDEFKNCAIFDYGTKYYSGQYEQHYAIQIETEDGEKYMFGFHKVFTSTNDSCKRTIEYEGKLYENPYNDCGQISVYVDPYISETDLVEEPIPGSVVAGYNLKLIHFIQKYADNIPFDGKNKVPFYNKYDLRELNR